MSVNLICAVLSGEGYDLRAVFNADEALNALDTFKPGLILMDIQLPGKSGLELTRQLRANPEMDDANIVTVTAYERKEDEEDCLNAGCDGYILKPIHNSMFPATVRAFIDKESRGVPNVQGDVRDLLRGMRIDFITVALAELAGLLCPDLQIHKNRLLRTLHRWAGIAGTLGMPGVTDRARTIEGLIGSAKPVDVPAVRKALQELQEMITAAAAAPVFELALPYEILKTLSGKRIALAGFGEPEARRIAQVLDRAECFTLIIEAPAAGFSIAMVEGFDVVILNLGGAGGPTCHKNTIPDLKKPVLLVGSRASISDSVVSVETATRDFLTTPWDSEELLVRSWKLLSLDLRNGAPVERNGPAQVVIADDDPAIGALLTATFRRTGAECRLARNGTEALALVVRLCLTL